MICQYPIRCTHHPQSFQFRTTASCTPPIPNSPHAQTLLRRRAAGIWPGREALAEGEADLSHLVTSYRGGYTLEARRDIEAEIKTGGLIGVCATNALEAPLPSIRDLSHPDRSHPDHPRTSPRAARDRHRWH